jgi:hypothetical protein
MRRLAIVAAALTVFGCTRGEQAADMTQDTTMAGPMAMISLADLAGTWHVSAKPEATDSVIATYSLAATADTAGWTITFPGRDPIPARVVSVGGDSVVVEAGPYESILRPGVMVWTRSVNRLHGGNLVGTFVAHYQTSTPDSVLAGRHEGTRVQ